MYRVKFRLDTPEGQNCALTMTYREEGRKKAQAMQKFVFPPEAAERLKDLLHDESMQTLVIEDAPAAADIFAGMEREYNSRH